MKTHTTVFLTPLQALNSVLGRKRAGGDLHLVSPGSLTQATHSAGTQVLSQVSRFGRQPIGQQDSKRHARCSGRSDVETCFPPEF